MIAEIIGIIEKYGLGNCVRWILENNSSQVLPYHGWAHSLWVAYYAEQIFQYEGLGKDTPKELILAALFHDVFHSGGFFTDDVKNIERAVAGFVRWAETDTSIDEASKASVIELIRDSKYPFTKPAKTTEQQILRESDMLQNCNDTLLANFVGIKQELFRYDPYTEYAKKSLEFLRSIKYETKYGKEVGQKKLETAINHLERFNRLVFADS